MMDLNSMGSLRRRQALQLLGALASSSLLVRPGSRRAVAQSLDPGSLIWDEVLVQARGTRVNWAMWSGSDLINGYVDGWVAEQLKADYDITLNRVPLGDTVEAVNKVVGEVQAGLTSGGDIDLIWINGVNFRTLKQGELLYGPFVDVLPSAKFYSLGDPRVGTDFGLPTEGYSAPYTGSYFAMAYDAAHFSNPPQSFDELLVWAEANPGRFGYVAPPDFNGNRFLLSLLYGVTGGFEQYVGSEFDEALWEQNSPQVFEYLAALKPYLWQRGSTYPPSQARIADLFANGEIWLMPFFVGDAAVRITEGQFPATTTVYAIPGAMLNDPSFTAIPVNAANPAGAMVVANLLASPEGQLEKLKPEVWGDPPLIDINSLPEDLQTDFAEVEANYGLPLRDLISDAVPIVNADYTTRLEENWLRQIATL